jgi:hypothetical protein
LEAELSDAKKEHALLAAQVSDALAKCGADFLSERENASKSKHVVAQDDAAGSALHHKELSEVSAAAAVAAAAINGNLLCSICVA